MNHPIVARTHGRTITARPHAWRVAGSVLAILLVSALPTSVLADTGDARVAFYQFDGARLAEVFPGAAFATARIAYEVDGREIRTERFVLDLTAGELATLPIPDPATLSVANDLGDRPGDLVLSIYAQDTLLESFTVAEYERYREQRLQQGGAALSALVAQWKRDRSTAVARVDASRADQGAVAQIRPSETIGRFGLDPCFRACFNDYLDCVRNDLSGCEASLQQCELGCPNLDSDNDGINNGSDNCPATSNANQANCDGDSFGDVCDSFNANYQRATADATCWTDKDNHVVYVRWEHHVEWREHDVSTCGAPDRWRNRIRSTATCVGTISDGNCCHNGIGSSVAQVGDNPLVWCEPPVRNVDFCQ